MGMAFNEMEVRFSTVENYFAEGTGHRRRLNSRRCRLFLCGEEFRAIGGLTVKTTILVTTALLGATPIAEARDTRPAPVPWDHPGHMITAAVAFSEIERMRPELIGPIGLLFLAHPDPAPFWVAAGDAKGKERVRRMFIESARWPDDSKFTLNDRPTWHMARWAIVADDATPEARAAAEARGGWPAGQALEALLLNYMTLQNPEASPADRARALGWVVHIVGDIHQPMHVGDLFSKDFPEGNAAGALSWVGDPMGTTIPLHMLWDSNFLRSPNLDSVSVRAQEFVVEYPRSSFPELAAGTDWSETFEGWARESHREAVEWAYDIETVPDPNQGQDPDEILATVIKFIVEGVSPVEEAPAVPGAYWERLQSVAPRRITLAGYRIADLVVAAADNILAEREFIGR
jgi:hypothetical protein